MIPRPYPAGFAPFALLLACALATRSIAGPIPAIPNAAPTGSPLARGAYVDVPPAAAPTARAPLATGTSSDGTWQEFNLLQVRNSLAIYDRTGHRLLAIGGSRLENWALPLGGGKTWEALPAPQTPETIDPLWSSVDPSTGLVYYVGFPSPGSASFEIHTLDPKTGAVAVIHASGDGPFNPTRGGVMFDPATKRVFVLQSFDSYDPNEEDPQVFVLDLSPTPVWSQLHPSGTPYPGRSFFFSFPTPAVLDPVRRRMVFTGALPDAQAGGTPAFWALTLDGPPQWLHFPTTHPPGSSSFVFNPLVYDASADRLVTIGDGGALFGLSLATFQWTILPVHAGGPSTRFGAGIAIDPVRHRLLVNGGSAPAGGDTFSDTWMVSLVEPTPWSLIVPDAVRAPIRGGASDAYDPLRHQLIVFGGSNDVGGFRNDTWVVDLAGDPSWSRLDANGTAPPPRYWHASVWDPVRDQMVVFGGYHGSFSDLFSDLWALSFAQEFPQAFPTWSPISPAGPAPAARYLPSLVYDSARDRFLLLFGVGENDTLLGDVWELRLSPTPAWRQLQPQGTPPAARGAQMCVYDPAGDRVLLFGGGSLNGFLNDVWALNLGSGDGTWQVLDVPAGPSVRDAGLLRLDPANDRLLLFGGYGLIQADSLVTYLDDTWALDLAGTPTWRLLSPAGFQPMGRDRSCGAYDTMNARLVVAGGGIEGSNDLFSLSFRKQGHAAVPPGAAQQLEAQPALALAVRTVAGRVSFSVQLATDEPAMLALFDLAGRRVWSTAVGPPGAGVHHVDMGVTSLVPAIYFARLTQGRSRQDARVAVVR